MVKAILFDLDNTLYDQAEYYRLAYDAVADRLVDHCDWSRERIAKRLFGIWQEHGSLYGHLFDDILKETKADDVSVKELVQVYHDAPVEGLRLYPGIRELLDMLTGVPVGIITNGNTTMQKAKVAALGLETYFDVIKYTDAAGRPKPDSYCYEQSADALGVPSVDCLYVGDNPPIDFPGARAVGMRTAWLRLGEFANLVESGDRYADHVASDVGELRSLVEECLGGNDDER